MNFATNTQVNKALQTSSGKLSSILQRKCICGNHTSKESECRFCKKKHQKLQRREIGKNSQQSVIPQFVHSVVRSSGSPLESTTRDFMESHLGHNFRQVRVHTDPEAARSAKAVNALAYTVGDHIVFGTAQHKPDSPASISLLAHELTHVTQQQGKVITPNEITSPGDAYEKEADHFADSASQAFIKKQRFGFNTPSSDQQSPTRIREDEDTAMSNEPHEPEFLYAVNGTTTCSFPAGTATVTISNTACTRPCTTRHEGVHQTDIAPCCTKAGRAHGAASTAAAKRTVERRFFTWMGSNRSWFECRAYAESVRCADGLLASKSCSSGPAPADATCCANLASYRADKETRRVSNCAAAGNSLSACPFT